MPRKVAARSVLPVLPHLCKSRAAARQLLRKLLVAHPTSSEKLVITHDLWVCDAALAWTDFLPGKMRYSKDGIELVIGYIGNQFDIDTPGFMVGSYDNKYCVYGNSDVGVFCVHKSSLNSPKLRKFQFSTEDGGELKDGYYLTGIKGLLEFDQINHYGSETPCPSQYMAAFVSEMYQGVSGLFYYSEDEAVGCGDAPPVDQQQGMIGYHEGRRSWHAMEHGIEHKEWMYAKDRLKNHKRMFGIELEIECHDEYYRPRVAQLASKHGFLGEDDGSLDDNLGIEIVAPPMTYADIHNPNGNWLTFLKSVKEYAKGWDAGQDTDCQYGMHISLNRMAMTPATAGKIYSAFHSMKRLCCLVAGRNCPDFAAFLSDEYFYRVPKKKQHLKRIVYGCNNHETQKYESASVRTPSRLEVRIFRSCLNPERFLRNVQFCSAMWDWAVASSMQCCGSEENFLRWFGSIQHHYPELASFIAIKHQKNPPFEVRSTKIKKMMEAKVVEA